MTPAELASAATELARSGIAVFPVRADKRPACIHGKDDATSDPAAARRLFLSARGAALIGRTTGATAGVAVIDVDPQGMSWLRDCWARLGPTRLDRSPRGGYHLIYRYPTGQDLRCSTAKLFPGVDIRGEGGSIIIPPSPGYETVDGQLPVPFPAWVLRRLAFLNKQRAAKAAAVADRYSGGGELAENAVAGLVRTVAQAGNGERNALLFWASCRLGAKGAGSDAQAQLVRAALSTGLDPVEVKLTLRSGLKAGRAGDRGRQ